jgi:protein-tyrosine phosphatase
MKNLKWKRKKMDEISSVIPGLLYISGYEPALEIENLKDLEIINVVRLGDKDDFMHYYITHDDVEYHDILIEDEMYATLTTEILDEATQFIHSSHSPVLVHCFAGVSRSASIVIAYLIRFHKMSFQAACDYLTNKHSRAQPNPKFLKDLMKYEYELILRRNI